MKLKTFILSKISTFALVFIFLNDMENYQKESNQSRAHAYCECDNSYFKILHRDVQHHNTIMLL